MHWTTLSDSEIFATPTSSQSASDTVTEEVTVGDAILVLTRSAKTGEATVSRVISPRASDYLRPDWQPGMPYTSR
ncbi:YlzJ-like family protein [Alicyclobacillus acidoterrestris]|uniref:YlzJ-like family protein n=1 Tax=Alicyclobacillus acidoterrestris (strain ATCC 49025 / DSM 3922 / CIP 106132 / NCIMB 13137 / GD3B) TaxID=1356854 RepID=T0BQB3_ALIAG|nr:YlzJ-like family protein [Alicyclobacillus acidoterrestris]EPZ46208.1 hypothetical protein N007_06855 [Alicyclobacillus acidoterrestris ATCC 49025]UNO47158.1 YlzJ-like family protein [Alicyclobacillus acidoterrestris]